MSDDNTLFIPIGHRCSSAAILDRCGLAGESLPFDSLVCQLGVVRDCLEHGFRDFLDVANYRTVTTRTVNLIDGMVEDCGAEAPQVNTHYEQATDSIADKDLTGRSTYHLQLALTHHDLSRPQDHATFSRRIERLRDALQSARRKVFFYIHPILGLADHAVQKTTLLETFAGFSAFLAKRYASSSGLFLVVVKSRDGVPTPASALLLKTASCSVYLIHANKDFVDAGGPFLGDCEREIQAMMKIVQRPEFSRGPTHKIYFPLFAHDEAHTNEIRQTLEGLLAHPQVTLVDRPELADHLILCQNHLVDHNPFHVQFRALKERYMERTIMLDYSDFPDHLFDVNDFRWRLYFKRSCVDRRDGRVVNYDGRAVQPTAYCVVNDMGDPPARAGHQRRIDVSCLFDDSVLDAPHYMQARGRLLTFAKRFAAAHPTLSTQIGTVSDCGSAGRARVDPRYKQCLFDSKIVLHANPDPWEGDSRLWEALAAGALVFVDDLYAPIKDPLINGEHLLFYDLTDEGMRRLEQKILQYLNDDLERERIGARGQAFVLDHHRSVDRVSAILRELECTTPEPRQSLPPASDLDIVVSIATGYQDVDQYRQFISTLRRTGATCPIFLGISDGPEYGAVKRYLLDNAVNYFLVPPIWPPSKVVNGYRFAQYRQWLDGLDFRHALLMDFRDAYFQRDPFADIDRLMRDCDLYLMSEFQFLTIGNHPNGMNCAWVAEPFGSEAADAIADKVILNSGAILGRKHAVMSLLDALTDVTTAQNFDFADQGTLNYLGHTGRLDRCGRIKIARAGESLVNNCGFTELDQLKKARPLTADEDARIAFIPRTDDGRLKLYRDHDGWVLDDDGNISCAVHQYDRFLPDIQDFVARLSDYQGPESVFVSSGNRSYRGERYTLSTREGLRADAVERLIRRIKSLAVDRKPLLLLNPQFKRGFAFAYGTLNIDLLFKSEAFRRDFFLPSDHAQDRAQDRARFLASAGYQITFIEEADIFLVPERPWGVEQTARSFSEARAQAERWTSPP